MTPCDKKAKLAWRFSAGRLRRLFILGSMLWPLAAFNATVTVNVHDYSFSPANVNIQVGDTVQWVWQNGFHSVTSGNGCVPDLRWDFSYTSEAAKQSVTFQRPGTYPYFCRPHCASDMIGRIVVADPTRPPQTRINDPNLARIKPSRLAVQLRTVSTAMVMPVEMNVVPGNGRQLIITDREGFLWSMRPNGKQAALIADIRSLLGRSEASATSASPQALLSAAWHPDYTTNGLAYTYTIEQAKDPDDVSPAATTAMRYQGVIREWHRSQSGAVALDPSSSRVLLRMDRSDAKAHAGFLRFGPDRLLYLGVAAEPGRDIEADDRSNQNIRLGNILRFDPLQPINPLIPDEATPSNSKAIAVPEANEPTCKGALCQYIFASGFHSLTGLSFDRRSGNLYAVDRGRYIQEVNLVEPNRNYGWPDREGDFCIDPNGGNYILTVSPQGCASDSTSPLAQYDRHEGAAIIGGFVYRGRKLRQLRGRYVFVERTGPRLAEGRLLFLAKKNIQASVPSQKSAIRELNSSRPEFPVAILGMGEDSEGELYLLAQRRDRTDGKNGIVLRLEP